MRITVASKTVFYSIEKAIKQYRKFAQRRILVEVKDLTIDQGLVLQFLDNYPELSQNEIAGMIFKDKASLTRIINLMVTKNYVLRSANKDDGRRSTLKITRLGKSTLKKMAPITSGSRTDALAGISNEEIEQLKSTLEKIISNCSN